VFADGLFIFSSSNPGAKSQSKPFSEEIILAFSRTTESLHEFAFPISDGAASVSIHCLDCSV